MKQIKWCRRIPADKTGYESCITGITGRFAKDLSVFGFIIFKIPISSKIYGLYHKNQLFAKKLIFIWEITNI